MTVIVEVWATPEQVFAVGVTVIVATSGVEPAFVVAKAAILPVPLAPRPMLVRLFVQLYVVPETAEPVKFIAVVETPLQTVWFDAAVTEGVGWAVMVKVRAVPEQPFAVGVTVIVATIGLPVTFVAVKAAIFPVPLAPKPILGVLFVQLYVVPATLEPLKVTAVVLTPLHNVWLETAVTEGVGLTVMVNV